LGFAQNRNTLSSNWSERSELKNVEVRICYTPQFNYLILNAMIKNLTLLAILLFLTETAVTQNKLPVIKATKKSVAIKDGDVFTKKAWSLSPEAKPDVFTATRTQKSKKVTFYTDLDSITVKVKPNSKYDFIILLNEKDTCFTQIRSAFQETDSERKDRLKYPNKADTIA
jgi:hypothetical protein